MERSLLIPRLPDLQLLKLATSAVANTLVQPTALAQRDLGFGFSVPFSSVSY